MWPRTMTSALCASTVHGGATGLMRTKRVMHLKESAATSTVGLVIIDRWGTETEAQTIRLRNEFCTATRSPLHCVTQRYTQGLC